MSIRQECSGFGFHLLRLISGYATYNEAQRSELALMADRDADDIEADLSKKQRLVNAWIAIGPDGKTTDVSELTDSSRGYASDIRRGLEGESDQEVSFETIEDAYHPALVQKYRSELGEDAVNGEWSFMDQLSRLPPSERGRSEQPERQQRESEQRRSTGGGREPHEQRQRPSGVSPQQPGQQPPGRQPQQPTAGPTGQPTPATQPTQPTPATQPTQRTQPTQARGQVPTTAQQPTAQPGYQTPQYGQLTQQQLQERLQSLDTSLETQQQVAQNEINSVPAQSVAQSIAISKYNLVVEVRQSIRELLETVRHP